MKKCPDCRDSELEWMEGRVDQDGLPIQYLDAYLKCSKCKQEFDPEDIEE